MKLRKGMKILTNGLIIGAHGQIAQLVRQRLLTETDVHLTLYLRNCLRSKLSFGILLQKRKLLCLIIPVILLANSLKSFAQN